MTTPWQPSPIWKGETVAVFATGPRMSQEIAESLRCHRTIAVNLACRLAPWADMLVVLDLADDGDLKEAESFAGMKVCAHEHPELDALCAGEMCQLVEWSPGSYTVIMNSGLAAIQIAGEMGAARIILAGFEPEAISHFYDDEVDTGDYVGVVEGLVKIVSELRAKGVTVDFDQRCSIEPGLSTAQAFSGSVDSLK